MRPQPPCPPLLLFSCDRVSLHAAQAEQGRMLDRKSEPKQQKPPEGSNKPGWRFSIGYFLLMLVLLLAWQELFTRMTVRQITYSDFKTSLASNEVQSIQIRGDEISGTITPKPGPHYSQTHTNLNWPTTPFEFRTVRVEDPNLVAELEAKHVQYQGVRPGMLTTFIWAWIFPIAIMMVLWMVLSKRMGSVGESVLSFGKSRARMVADQETGVTFNDVAGCDEAKYELQEVVDFLRNPDRYKSLGAKIPKGVLLVGPPGTGKTLLARAVAGEAKVPFFQLSGSDFVEMFVGVGAARVRDLFQQAKVKAPCIVFIDELDAIGRQRGVHVGSVNDEREQTLNQLLVEMDGFEANAGVILLAATNRPDVLDRALLRPGRFDRQVVVDAPDIDGREAILKVHSRNIPLLSTVELRKIAQATPGFSGADLANALNEAALLAARRHGKAIDQHDLEQAIEKVVAGPERKSRRLNQDQKKRVAFHEVGHALVAAYSKHADPVHKISIIPRGRAALGYTMQLPSDDQFLLSQEELMDKIRGILGGRASEEIIFHDITTGAENDLERATALARQMVCIYGMSEKLGLAHCATHPGPVFMQGNASLQRDCSEQTAREIDEEVKRILDLAYVEAREILLAHQSQLATVTAELLKHETLDSHAFNELIGRDPNTPVGDPDVPTTEQVQEPVGV